MVEYTEAAQAIVFLATEVTGKKGGTLEGHIKEIVEKLYIESHIHLQGLENALNHVI